MRRIIGIDIHRTFAEVVFWEVIGGRGDPPNPGRSTANPDKSVVAAAVEKMPAPKDDRLRPAGHPHSV
jgi:hypothetical protein